MEVRDGASVEAWKELTSRIDLHRVPARARAGYVLSAFRLEFAERKQISKVGGGIKQSQRKSLIEYSTIIIARMRALLVVIAAVMNGFSQGQAHGVGRLCCKNLLE